MTPVRATSVAFFGSGFAFASWASRIPQVRDELGLSPAELGLLLFSIAAGSIVALPLAGPVVHHWGSRRTVEVMAVVLAAGLVIAAVGTRFAVAPVAVGLFLLGLGNGAWDVAMNVQAALVEKHVDRSIMSRFHAGWSLGTVAGAVLGAAAVGAGFGVTSHLVVVAVGTAAGVLAGTRSFLDDRAAARAQARRRLSALAAWREPRTLLIGVFVLAFAFAEGAGNDWVSLASIDGHRSSAAVGTLVFATFLAAMTTGRWFGPALLDRHGRVPVVRTLAGVAVVGSLLFVLAPWLWLAVLGAVLWGLGASLGFPTGMSAAADDPVQAASRVSVVASIGYCAFLGGPPLVGYLGDQLSVLRALAVVPALLVLAASVSSSVSPLEQPAPAR